MSFRIFPDSFFEVRFGFSAEEGSSDKDVLTTKQTDVGNFSDTVHPQEKAEEQQSVSKDGQKHVQDVDLHNAPPGSGLVLPFSSGMLPAFVQHEHVVNAFCQKEKSQEPVLNPLNVVPVLVEENVVQQSKDKQEKKLQSPAPAPLQVSDGLAASPKAPVNPPSEEKAKGVLEKPAQGQQHARPQESDAKLLPKAPVNGSFEGKLPDQPEQKSIPQSQQDGAKAPVDERKVPNLAYRPEVVPLPEIEQEIPKDYVFRASLHIFEFIRKTLLEVIPRERVEKIEEEIGNIVSWSLNLSPLHQEKYAAQFEECLHEVSSKEWSEYGYQKVMSDIQKTVDRIRQQLLVDIDSSFVK